jgi:serine/threonine protein kinase
MKFCPQCDRDFDENDEICPDDGSKLLIVRVEEDDLVGRTIDKRYTIIEKIGEGGMGRVFLAMQEAVGREIAIKILRKDLATDETAVKRFFHEARIVSQLRHPNTITLFDFGQTEDALLYIAMEYLQGDALDVTIEKRSLDLSEIIEIAEQICESLSEAHEHNIVHRDLKPENIFIDRVGSRNIVKVMDFGIAKIKGVQSNLTLTGMVYGTPAYMSPEQAQGFEIDHRTDIYSLGVVFFELLCGRLPYMGESAMKVAMAHILGSIPDPAEHTRFDPTPPKLVALIHAMLAKNPDERPHTVEEVARTLAEANLELAEMPRPRVAKQSVGSNGGSLDSSTDHVAQLVQVRERVAKNEKTDGLVGPTSTGPQERRDILSTSQLAELGTDDTLEEDVAAAAFRSRAGLYVGGALLTAGLALTIVMMTSDSSDDTSSEEPEVVAIVSVVEEEESGIGEGGTPELEEHTGEAEETEVAETIEAGETVVAEAVEAGEGEVAEPVAVLTTTVTVSYTANVRARLHRIGVEGSCRTPCDIEVERSDETFEVAFSRRGYVTETLTVHPDHDHTISALLVRRPDRDEREEVEEEEEEEEASITAIPILTEPEVREEESGGLNLMPPVTIEE